jgi:putative membrane protein
LFNRYDYSLFTALFIQLLLCAAFYSALLIVFHSGSRNVKTGFVFGFILWPFLIEFAGVYTGNILVNTIRKRAGIKVGNTPLLIGVNWLLMVYLSANLTAKLQWGAIASVVTASLVMVAYDIVLEQVAPALEMWYWRTLLSRSKLVAWFVCALIFHAW